MKQNKQLWKCYLYDQQFLSLEQNGFKKYIKNNSQPTLYLLYFLDMESKKYMVSV